MEQQNLSGVTAITFSGAFADLRLSRIKTGRDACQSSSRGSSACSSPVKPAAASPLSHIGGVSLQTHQPIMNLQQQMIMQPQYSGYPPQSWQSDAQPVNMVGTMLSDPQPIIPSVPNQASEQVVPNAAMIQPNYLAALNTAQPNTNESASTMAVHHEPVSALQGPGTQDNPSETQQQSDPMQPSQQHAGLHQQQQPHQTIPMSLGMEQQQAASCSAQTQQQTHPDQITVPTELQMQMQMQQQQQQQQQQGLPIVQQQQQQQQQQGLPIVQQQQQHIQQAIPMSQPQPQMQQAVPMSQQQPQMQQAIPMSQPQPQMQQAIPMSQPQPQMQQAIPMSQPQPQMQQAIPMSQPQPQMQQAIPMSQPQPQMQQAIPMSQPQPQMQQAIPMSQQQPQMQQAVPMSQPQPQMQQAVPMSQQQPQMQQAIPMSQPQPQMQQAIPMSQPQPQMQQAIPMSQPQLQMQQAVPFSQPQLQMQQAVPFSQPQMQMQGQLGTLQQAHPGELYSGFAQQLAVGVPQQGAGDVTNHMQAAVQPQLQPEYPEPYTLLRTLIEYLRQCMDVALLPPGTTQISGASVVVTLTLVHQSDLSRQLLWAQSQHEDQQFALDAAASHLLFYLKESGINSIPDDLVNAYGDKYVTAWEGFGPAAMVPLPSPQVPRVADIVTPKPFLKLLLEKGADAPAPQECFIHQPPAADICGPFVGIDRSKKAASHKAAAMALLYLLRHGSQWTPVNMTSPYNLTWSQCVSMVIDYLPLISEPWCSFNDGHMPPDLPDFQLGRRRMGINTPSSWAARIALMHIYQHSKNPQHSVQQASSSAWSAAGFGNQPGNMLPSNSIHGTFPPSAPTQAAIAWGQQLALPSTPWAASMPAAAFSQPLAATSFGYPGQFPNMQLGLNPLNPSATGVANNVGVGMQGGQGVHTQVLELQQQGGHLATNSGIGQYGFGPHTPQQVDTGCSSAFAVAPSLCPPSLQATTAMALQPQPNAAASLLQPGNTAVAPSAAGTVSMPGAPWDSQAVCGAIVQQHQHQQHQGDSTDDSMLEPNTQYMQPAASNGFNSTGNSDSSASMRHSVETSSFLASSHAANTPYPSPELQAPAPRSTSVIVDPMQTMPLPSSAADYEDTDSEAELQWRRRGIDMYGIDPHTGQKLYNPLVWMDLEMTGLDPMEVRDMTSGSAAAIF
eukprot:jgi/Chrzof1/2735/Cz11g27090.t1